MSLRLSSEGSPGEALRRVLLALARQAQRDIKRVGEAPERRIHGLRTGMKKYRSLLRLARGGMKTRQKKALLERVRVLKDGMAGSRDEVVIFETVRHHLGAAAIRRLGLKRPHEEAKAEAPETLLLAADELVLLSETLALDDLDADDLESRWKRSLRRTRKAMKAAGQSGEDGAFHFWRKHAKDVWYQSAALGGFGKKMAAQGKFAKRLSEVLGDEHDLTIVLASLKDLTTEDRGACEEARADLRASAFALAARMKP